LDTHQAGSASTSGAGERRIVFVTYEGMRLLDLTGPLEAFAIANETHGSAGPAPYDLRVVSERGGLVQTSSGLAVPTEPLSSLGQAAVDTVITVGGAAAFRANAHPAAVENWIESQRRLVEWIAQDGARARRVCSVCSGTFLLAAAQQLKGRTVATHWASAQLLATCFPEIRVEPDRIFVRDDSVWTSGGVTTGIDLALALIEDDLGSEVALQVARVMVVFAKRPGGQSQFSVPLAAQLHSGDFSALHAWIVKHLAEDLRIEDLAAQAGMSRSTFIRSYVSETGRTPHKAIEAMRLSAARMALEATSKSLKEIARETGFGGEERMRRVFSRQLGVGPADYRARFSLSARRERSREEVRTGVAVA
jgi:transcriptional regulator GlxA family with amidase domain